MNPFRKAEPASSPYSPFSGDGVPEEWASPSAPLPGGNASGGGDIASEFLAEEPASAPFGSSAAPSAPASTRNVLNSDVTVVGTLRFTDDLLVDGSVEGEITSDGVLTVGANATIQAGEKNKVAVRTKSAIIHGRVTGDVVVTDRVELAATAELVGDITAARIAIQEGATFVGHCAVGNIAAMPVPPASTTPKRSSKRPVVHDDTADLLV